MRTPVRRTARPQRRRSAWPSSLATLGLVLGAELAVTGALAAQPQERMVGVTWSGDFVRIDPTDGSSVRIGPTGFPELNSLAGDSQGRLLAVGRPLFGSPRLVEIDPYTGRGEFFRYAFLNHVTGLAFSPDDVLYAVDTQSSVRSYLYRYDLTGPPPDAVRVLVDRLTDHTMQSQPVYGLAFAPDGQLYAWSTIRGLMRVNPDDAFCVDVNGYDDGHSLIQSLAFAADGTLYGARESVFRFDLATGVYTFVGAQPEDLRGTEFVSGLPAAPPRAPRVLGLPIPSRGWPAWKSRAAPQRAP